MSDNLSETLWEEGNDPLVLLEDLYPKRTPGSEQHQERKCRLYLTACARRQWDRLPGVSRALVELAECDTASDREWEERRALFAPVAEQLMHSDGEPADLHAACLELTRRFRAVPDALQPKVRAAHGPNGFSPAPPLTPPEWHKFATLVYLPFVQKTPPFGWVPEELHSVALLKEVYYNPYAFVTFLDEWRDAKVLAIARHVYDAREFSGMPVLADALQEAGCDCPLILGHCRDQPVDSHARGCWVLDLVLNREVNGGLFTAPV